MLANEMFAGRLGKSLGLPVAEVKVIDVGAALVDCTPGLCIDLGGTRLPCSSGRQVASRYVSDPERSMVFDFLPENFLTNVANLGDFARVLVLDKWAANSDGRQAVFALNPLGLRRYAATFVDHGYCFGGGNWTFADLPLLGTYGSKLVYQSVTGWQSFEPTLSRAEGMSADQIWRCAGNIPGEWYEHDIDALMQLAEELYRRRSRIRELITAFRTSTRNPFPNWTTSSLIS